MEQISKEINILKKKLSTNIKYYKTYKTLKE